ncbi:MAG: alpha/beta hydrolase [Novosphingobium sp.]|nr:alpha/beta hydrolase [Novosphingobium sp.]
MAAGLRRRIALALQRKPEHAPGPPIRLLLREALALPALVPGLVRIPPVTPTNRPSTVMVIPGFLADAAMVFPLLGAIEVAGHRVSEWGMGINNGATAERLAELARRVEALSVSAGQPVALVGWSLGGLFAREVARLVPKSVRLVVTMGTPFAGDPRANNAWRLYQLVAGYDVDHPPVAGNLADKPPVRTVALWSQNDGIIAPECASGAPGERDEAVELTCKHMAFPSDMAAISEVLRQLDLQD